MQVQLLGGVLVYALWAVAPLYSHNPARFVVLARVLQMPRGNALLAGADISTHASKPLARIFAAIFSMLEDASQGERDRLLTWMPAHTPWAAIDVRRRSDGKAISGIDWRANRLVDAAAKIAAKSCRAPWATRRVFSRHSATALHGIARAGMACHAAHHTSFGSRTTLAMLRLSSVVTPSVDRRK